MNMPNKKINRFDSNIGCQSSAYDRFVEFSVSLYNDFLVAVWMVNSKLPVWWFKPRLNQIGMVTLDSFGDSSVYRMNPRLISWKHFLRAFTYPFRFWAHILRVMAILRKVERDSAGCSSAKVTVKFQQFIHTQDPVTLIDGQTENQNSASTIQNLDLSSN